MNSFLNDFSVFFNKMFDCVVSIWNWLISTTIGEIIIFTIIISFFLFVLNLFVDFKD